MSSLRQLQQDLQAFLLNQDPAICDSIADSQSLAARESLNIYRNGYYLRLVGILANDYNILAELIGKKRFETLLHDYLNAHPSHSFTVRTIGKYLPEFIDKRDEFEPGISELAGFEWSLNEILCLPDVPVLTMDDLAQLSEDQWLKLVLKCQPSLRLFKCEYNTLEVWKNSNEHQAKVASAMLAETMFCIIWRKEREAYFYETSKEEAALIQAIIEGDDFETLCQKMLTYYDEDAVVSWIADTLKCWMGHGFFVKDFSA